MAQNDNQNRFGGRYLVQDQNHMSEIGASPATSPKTSQKATPRTGVRQSEQSQTVAGQQGGSDQHAPVQQGGERTRKGR